MADTASNLGSANYKDLRKLQVYRLGSPSNASSSKTYTMSDYHWSEFSHIVPSDPDYIQKIILEEFQPNPVIDTGEMIDSLLNSDWLASIVKPKGGGVGEALMKAGSGVLGNLVKAGMTATSAITEAALMEQAYKNPTSLIDFPIKILKSLFPGKFLNTYELPYFEPKYLQSDPAGSWTAKGGEQLYGTKAKTLMKEGMGIEFPTTPKWSIEGSGTAPFTNFEFYLINDTDEHLFQNFKLIHSFMSGTMWIQLGGVQKSPNVYQVTIPGRDFRFFCSVKLTASMAGKLRTNQLVAHKIRNQNTGLGTKDYYEYTVGAEGSGGSEYNWFMAIGDGNLFPDAYHVKFSIDELTPNHFNNYINYMMNGTNQVSKGVSQSAYINQPIEVIKDVFRGTRGVIGEVEDYAVDTAGNVAGGVVGAVAGKTIGGMAKTATLWVGGTAVNLPSNVASATMKTLQYINPFKGWGG